MLPAIKTHCNLRVAQKLADEMQSTLERCTYSHVGSHSLWNNHYAVVNRLQLLLKTMRIPEVSLDFDKLQVFPHLVVASHH